MAKIFYSHHCVPNEILSKSAIDNWFALSLEQFENFLERNASSFSNFDKSISSTNKKVLTFDDGYQSTKDFVLPILEKFQVPIILFIRTDTLKGAIPYEIALAKLFINLDFVKLPNSESLNLKSETERKKRYDEIRLRLKFSTTKRKMEFVRQTYHINNCDYPTKSPISFLDAKQLVELSKHPLVTIGAHTIDHPAYTLKSGAGEYDQISSSKGQIEDIVDEKIRLFSYPYGRNTFITRYLVNRAGYSFAFTTEEQDYNSNNANRIMRVPRYNLDSYIRKIYHATF